MSRKRKKQPVWQSLLSVLLVAVVLFYLGYQAYRSIVSGVTTEMAVVHSVYESIETEGMVFRSETVVPAAEKGHCYYAIENGTRVSKNSVIASIYSDADSGRIEQQMQQIDDQIDALKAIQAEGSSGRVTLDVINEQLHDEIYDLIRSTDSGLFEEMETARFSLLSLLSKKQLVTGKTLDFSAKIQQLEAEKSRLKEGYKSATSVLRAPVAGYFADQMDGYEAMLTTDQLPKLSVGKLQEFLDMSHPAGQNAGGKIVSGYEWYMACVVPDTHYSSLAVGNTLSLRMSFVLDEPVPVTVYACNKDNKGNMAVVFRCDYMSEELATIRKETVEIQLVKHTGLKVPKKAIVINEEQQAGVYVRSGNIVSFRMIQQEYSEPAEYVICKEVTDSGYLRLYDDIIVGGRGLYDGKIIP